MLFTIDQWILNCFEFGCNLFANLTGKNNYFLARSALLVYSATSLIFDILMANNLSIVCLILKSFLIPLLLLLSYKQETRMKNLNPMGLANDYKINPGLRFERLLMIILCLFGIYFFINMPSIIHGYSCVSFISYWFYIYLLACDTKPPTKSLVRQWAESLMAKKPVLVPVPVKR